MKLTYEDRVKLEDMATQLTGISVVKDYEYIYCDYVKTKKGCKKTTFKRPFKSNYRPS